MRKYIISLLLAASAAIGVSAQQVTGSWHVYPMRGVNMTRMADMADKLFFLTGGSLYAYDKSHGESEFLTPGESLSGYSVKDIYPNPDKKFIAVVYNGGNIDLIYEDGKMVNMPDIRDANLLTTREIRDVEYVGDRMYIATDFGFVCFDTKDHYVLESGIYNKAIDQICVVGDRIFASVTDDKAVYSAPVEGRHKDFSVFELWSGLGNPDVKDMKSCADGSMVVISGNDIRHAVIDAENKTFTLKTLRTLSNCSMIERNVSGFTAFNTSDLIFIDGKTMEVKRVQLGDLLKNQKVSSWEGLGKVWAGDWQGVGCYDLSGATPTVLSDKFQFESSQMLGAGCFVPSADGTSVFVSNISTGRNFNPVNAYNNIKGVVLEEYDWQAGTFTSKIPVQTTGGNIGRPQITDGLFFLLDHDDPSVIYVLSIHNGIYVVKDDKVVGCCRIENTPWDKTWSPWVLGMAYDKEGNLWVGDKRADPKNAVQYTVLPKDKLSVLRTDPTAIKPSDWQITNIPVNIGDDYRYHIVFSTKNPTRAIHIPDFHQGFIGIDTKGTLAVSDDSYSIYSSFVTQDGNSFGAQAYHCVVEDKKGNIWIGSDEGIVVIEDVEQLGHSASLNVVRPKVSRNDGTVYADYLLSTDRILSIAVDPNNRKWVATAASGLFLVSEDGTEILQNFTKDNSPLPTNEVWGVYCDPNGNGVLVAGPAGMYLYSSTSAPGADGFDDVYAYPNPVTPDYQGWITVRGLMSDSLVKIADMQGNVVAQGRSEGGMFVWDGCNSAGQRVRSGVYLVLASQYDGSKSTGAVTKIVVIN